MRRPLRWRPRTILPLLRKDLVELSARRGTYITRIVYAAFLFLIAAFVIMDALRMASMYGMGVIGSGSRVFESLVMIQFAGIFVLLPAITSSALTTEKERQTLPLLLVTELRPWEILIEKYVGRLVPMVTLLLLSLPLFAVAYSLGGIPPGAVVAAGYFLLLACLQVAAIGMACSAFCRTTVGAFLMTYIVGATFFILPPLVGAILAEGGVVRFDEHVWLAFFPPYVFDTTMRGTFTAGFVRSAPILLSVALFLLAARVFLLRRAFVAGRSHVLRIMQRLDKFWLWVNEWGAGGVILWKDRGALPGDEPVTWLEATKKALGKWHYLLRLFLVMEVPLLFICLANMFLSNRGYGTGQSEVFAVMLFIAWPIIALTLVVQGANLISAERTHQTLDVLLSTPMSGASIIRQKMRGARRLHLLMAVVLLTVYTFEFIEEGWTQTMRWRGQKGNVADFLCGVLSIFFYIPLFSWASCWLGLRIKHRGRAIIVAVIGLVAWCVVPLISGAVLYESGFHALDDAPYTYLALSSPAVIVVLAEVGEWREFDYEPIIAMILNFSFYGALWWWFRRRCLHRADRYLGRIGARGEEGPWFGESLQGLRLLWRLYKRHGNAGYARPPAEE